MSSIAYFTPLTFLEMDPFFMPFRPSAAGSYQEKIVSADTIVFRKTELPGGCCLPG